MKYQESVLRKLSLTGAIVLILWVCWYNLGGMTIRLWDESRMAINALEMYESRHYWVTTFEHQPDLWNTKPPLMIWLQVLSLHIFGVHDWVLRIPAALAATATFTAIFHFC
jgi:4-amino-4-deoxy-L-arabinose transferase-like glycosyltransferase